MLKLLYFAGLREALGTAGETLALPRADCDVAGLREHLAARGGVWAEQFTARRNLRAAVNQDMAAAATALCDGDEVAFFPPVTGG